MRDRQKLFSAVDRPVRFEISRWSAIISKYDIHLKEILESLEKKFGLWFHGNFMGVVGILGFFLEKADSVFVDFGKVFTGVDEGVDEVFVDG